MPIAGYIREQPGVVRRVFAEVPAQLDPLRRALPARPRAVALIGSGTSRHALLATEAFLSRRLHCPVTVVSPMGFMAEPPPWATDGALAIVLSQSGASAATVEAAAFARTRGMATLAITAEARSRMAAALTPLVIMPVGPETVGPKTKGYTGSVATLLCLGLVLGETADWPGVRAEVEAVCTGIASNLGRWEAAATALAGDYAQTPHLMVLGQGRHRGTAKEAALKITEMSGVAAAAFDTEEALHGRFQALLATTPVFFVARGAHERQVAVAAAAALAELGVPHHLLTPGDARSDLDIALPRLAALPELDLVAAIVPFQWFARALAVARGMAPEHMRYPGLSARLGIATARADREEGRGA